jgi:hypothetical protein
VVGPLPKRIGGWLAALLLAAAAVGTFGVGVWGWTVPEPSTWPLFAAASRQPRVVMPLAQGPLPIAAANETYLTRARAQFARGRVRDALHELDRIPVGDPLRADADRLRAEVQRQLLSVAAAEQSPE